MNSRNGDASIYQYLNSLNSGPLLTKEEEGTLIKNIEVYQKEIVDGCLKFSYSRFELLSYLKSLKSRDELIVDISKKLDEESPKELVEEVSSKFDRLIEILDTNSSEVQELLTAVGLSGTIIHGIVTEIKKKHSRITDIEYKVKQVRKWFDDRPFDNVIEIIEKIRSHDDIRAKLKVEMRMTELQLLNKCGEWENTIREYREAQTSLPEGITFQDVKDSYKAIATSEMHMKKSKDVLTERNLRLVVARAKRLLNRGLEFEDLIQEGNIGLMKAIDKYDSSKKTKVATYATWWIDQSMRRAISNKGKTVRIPTHIEFLQTNVAYAIQKLTGLLKRPPSLEEISKEVGVELSVLQKLQTTALHEVGIEDELSSGQQLIDILPSDPTASPHNLAEGKILNERIRSILSSLKPRDEMIIRLRFGIGEIPKELQQHDTDEKEEGLTLQVIGDHIGITKQGVRQVECSALKKIKKKAQKYAEEA